MTRRLFLLLAALTAVATNGAVSAGPAACASPCTVHVSGFGFVAEMSPILESGTVVRFTTAEETAHPTTDDEDPFTRCFYVPVGYGEPDAFVRFDIADGAVHATVAPGTEFETTSTCPSAMAGPEGAFILRYHCNVHPWMRSAFVVEPTA